MKRLYGILLPVAWIITILASQVIAQDDKNLWTRYRGPNGAGFDSRTALPTDLADSGAKWNITLAGSGHSSPIAWDDQLIVTSFVDPNQFVVQAIDVSSGKQQWEWKTTAEPHPMHRLNSVAASTPATDGTHVFCLIPSTQNLRLVALDMQGHEKWNRDLGPWVAQHGFGISPCIYDDEVIVVNSQEPFAGMPTPGKSEVIAVNAEDGQDVWRTPIAGERACYGVPIIYQNGFDATWVIGASTGEGFYALDAKTGKQEWARSVFKQRIVGSPIMTKDRLIGNNGSGGGGNYLVSLDLADTEHKVKYELHRAIGYVPTLISVNQLLFSCTDSGMISCFDLESGSEKWTERVSSGFWSSPVSDGKHLFCLDKDGTLHVLAATEDFKQIGKFDYSEPTEATPAIHGGRLFVRTEKHLRCFESNR